MTTLTALFDRLRRLREANGDDPPRAETPVAVGGETIRFLCAEIDRLKDRLAKLEPTAPPGEDQAP